MQRKYLKMNDGKGHLSLGNLFNFIKELANNKSSAMQSEIFCSLFLVNEINNTTVNNYCIGCRAIGILYKKTYIDLKNNYEKDEKVFIKIILSIMSIIDEHVYMESKDSIKLINGNKKLTKLNQMLFELSLTDPYVSESFINNQKMLLTSNYKALISNLLYIVLENIQPIYIKELNIKINQSELNEYMKIKLYEGFSYITSLKEIAKKGNMYANAELGSLEFSGLITGEYNYDDCYNYYYKAALKGHPKASFMAANLILTNRVNKDFKIAWEYLNKAISLGSISALNTMGKCFLNGNTPNKEKNISKAIEYFEKASESGYTYAYNNLGLIKESEGNIEEAIKYYKISADLKESWALNKVGEYYRKKGDLKTAYLYYLESSMCPISERNYYSYYNLATYYYKNGFKDLGIKKDEEKAKKYLKIFKEKTSLKEKFANYNGLNQVKEFEWDDPKGREIW